MGYAIARTNRLVLGGLRLPFQVLGYRLSRRFGWPQMPMSIAYWLTGRCNSRCRTCGIWKKRDPDLSLREWRQTISSTGRPLWVTLTGGEPFLRHDLPEIVRHVCELNRPLYLNICTNGLDTKRIMQAFPAILEECQGRGTELGINVSLDELDARYDRLRGTKGGFRRVRDTLRYLKKRRSQGFRLGVNITVSRFNQERFWQVHAYARKSKPDEIVVEPATQRAAFGVRRAVAPEPEALYGIMAALAEQEGASVVSRFRRRYYAALRDSKQPLHCYAGLASAEISPDGTVLACCEGGHALGTLRNRDFRQVWRSRQAAAARHKVSSCSGCTLANPYYTNTLITAHWAKY